MDDGLGFRDPAGGGEVSADIAVQGRLMIGGEVLQRLHLRKVGSLDPEGVAVRFPVCDLWLQHRGEVVLMGPALIVGLVGELLPTVTDRRSSGRHPRCSNRAEASIEQDVGVG